MGTPYTERAFRGLDVSREPDDLDAGRLVQADNVVLEGLDLVSRPGLRVQSLSLIAAAPRSVTSVRTGATDKLVGFAGGKTITWSPNTFGEALVGGVSTTFATDNVQTARVLDNAFIVDGVLGLHRLAGGVVTAMTSLLPPDAPTAANLTWRTLLANLAAATWTQNTTTGTTTTPTTGGPTGDSGEGNVIAPGSSIATGDRNFPGTGENVTGEWWEYGGNATVGDTATHNGDTAVELDSLGEYAQSGPIVLNARSVSGYAPLFVVEYEVEAEQPPADAPTESVDMIARAYSNTAATTEITAGRQVFRSPLVSERTGQRVRELVDWRHLASEATPPRAARIRFEQPNSRPTNVGVNVNRAAVYIPEQKLDIERGADGLITLRQGTVQTWLFEAENGNQGRETQARGRLYTAGLGITTTISSASWTGVSRLALYLSAGAGVQGLAVRLAIKSGATTYRTDALEIPVQADGSSAGWASVDISAIRASLTAVTEVTVEIIDDVTVDTLSPRTNAPILRVGELRDQGALLEENPYWYVVSELDDQGDTNLLDVVWSDGSTTTGLLQPGPGAAMARLVLPARKNAAADYIAVWRFGGPYTDERVGTPSIGRLVAMIRWDAATFATGGNVAAGAAPYILADANPYISWTAPGSVGGAGGIIVDNTPDSWISGVELYQPGRERPPTAPDCVAFWDGRLWLSDGAELFASWMMESAKSALYWTRITLPVEQDPFAEKRGWWARLQLRSEDRILRLLPMDDTMLVLTRFTALRVRRRPGAVPDYEVREIEGDAGATIGLVGHEAAAEHDGAALWLSPEGLMSWSGGKLSRWGNDVQRYLTPDQVPGGLPLSPAALSRAVIVPGPKYVFVLLPQSSTDTRPTCALVWHVRERGWTRWLGEFTGGALLATASSAAQLYLMNYAGEILAVSGQGDIVRNPGGSALIAATVPVTVQSRRFGTFEAIEAPEWLAVDVECADATPTITATIRGDVPAAEVAAVIGFTGSASTRTRISRSAGGRQHQITFTASTTNALRLRGFSLATHPVRRPRG